MMRRCADKWEKQKALGVSNAYIPAEVLLEKQVTIEEAAAAIQTLVTNSEQLHELPSATANEALPATATEPEPKLEAEPDPQPESEIDVSLVKAQTEQMREHLRSNNAMKASLGRAWACAHELFLIVQRDGSGQIIDVEVAEEVSDRARELDSEL